MKKYICYNREDMILRDHLATDRTVLANERTFLAYLRTALSLIVSGASFIKFSDTPFVQYIGYFLIPLGLYIAFVGTKNHINMRKDFLIFSCLNQKMNHMNPKMIVKNNTGNQNTCAAAYVFFCK